MVERVIMERVDSYKYLSIVITKDNTSVTDIKKSYKTRKLVFETGYSFLKISKCRAVNRWRNRSWRSSWLVRMTTGQQSKRLGFVTSDPMNFVGFHVPSQPCSLIRFVLQSIFENNLFFTAWRFDRLSLQLGCHSGWYRYPKTGVDIYTFML